MFSIGHSENGVGLQKRRETIDGFIGGWTTLWIEHIL
jgi:hypothetical protein